MGRGSSENVRPGRRVMSKKLSEVRKIMSGAFSPAGVPGWLASSRNWATRSVMSGSPVPCSVSMRWARAA